MYEYFCFSSNVLYIIRLLIALLFRRRQLVREPKMNYISLVIKLTCLPFQKKKKEVNMPLKKSYKVNISP